MSEQSLAHDLERSSDPRCSLTRPEIAEASGYNNTEEKDILGTSPTTSVHSAVVDGVRPMLLNIETGFTRGFAGLTLIGNASDVCRDGKERARAALERLGVMIPAQRLVISLSPADVRKDGSHLDLPIAVSLLLLLASPGENSTGGRYLYAAELGLQGELRPVRGIVSLGLLAMSEGLDGVVVAAANRQELEVVRSLVKREQPFEIQGFSSLNAVADWRLGGSFQALSPEDHSGSPSGILSGTPSGARVLERVEAAQETLEISQEPTFDDMILSPEMERAAVAAAAGMHSVLQRGTPGTGKSMFAARVPSILPPLRDKEHLESLQIYSALAARIPRALLAGRPPFRAPHHQASSASLLGTADHPGELALAHGGVLFLDELPEFRRDLLEALREPLEVGEVHVSRAKRKVSWSCRVLFLAACNNCPCGWFGSTRRECFCPTPKLLAYQQRLSGPLLDRIDIHLQVPEPKERSGDLVATVAKLSSQYVTDRMRQQVIRARDFAHLRNQRLGVHYNRDLSPQQLLSASGQDEASFVAMVNQQLPSSLSRRAVVRCLRVARTLADMDQSWAVLPEHLEQARHWLSDAQKGGLGELVRGRLGC